MSTLLNTFCIIGLAIIGGMLAIGGWSLSRRVSRLEDAVKRIDRAFN